MSKSKLKRLAAQGTIVIVKCITCGAKREVRAGEIDRDDQPLCSYCYAPMVAESVLVKEPK